MEGQVEPADEIAVRGELQGIDPASAAGIANAMHTMPAQSGDEIVLAHIKGFDILRDAVGISSLPCAVPKGIFVI